MVDFAAHCTIHATKIGFKIVHFTWKVLSLKVVHLPIVCPSERSLRYRISLNRSRTLINSRPQIGRLVALLPQSINSRTSNRARTSAHRSIMTTPPYVPDFVCQTFDAEKQLVCTRFCF